MCGHGSITFSLDFDAKPGMMQKGASALLKRLDHRGGDACGIMSCDADGAWLYEKAAVRALGFDKDRAPISAATRALAVHTRMATRGHEAWEKNNHPVIATSSKRTALVMHNGVVQDSDLKRKPGDPLVDTFAMAVSVSEARRRQGNERAQNYAETLAQSLADWRGSMTAQVAIQGEAFLASIRVRSNPLFVGVNAEDTVRVTASTYDAVEFAFAEMGILVGMQTIENTVQPKKHGRGKGKAAQPIEVPSIWSTRDGTVITWDKGVHTARVAELKQPVYVPPVTTYRPAAPYKPYTPPSQSGIAEHGRNTVVPRDESRKKPTHNQLYNVGDTLKVIATGRHGVVKGVSWTQHAYWYEIDVFETSRMIAGKAQTLNKYTGQLSQGSLTLVTKKSLVADTAEVVVLPTYVDNAIEAVKRAPASPFAQGEVGPVSTKNLGNIGVQVVTGETWNDLVARLTSEDNYVRCEICGDYDDRTTLVEDCIMCSECVVATRDWMGA